MALSPKESGKFIAENAKHVKIHQRGIEKLGDKIVNEINNGTLSVDNFSQNQFHPKSTDPRAIDWIFVVDILNFCFWPSGEGKKGWLVEEHGGYYALCAAINRAVRENIDITNPHFYSTITKEQLNHILRGDNNRYVPMLNERVASLHESGANLIEYFDGTFVNVVKHADNSAVKLLKLIIDYFPCFRDEAVYNNTHVSLYKRAQILVGDIWACFRNEGIAKFPDINELTMFADYRVPQTLLYWGVFEYGPELKEAFEEGGRMENGNEMEVEIRGCSIHAVELLRDYAAKKVDEGKIVNSVLIDHYLWDFRRDHAHEIARMKLPFHKTICIYY